MVLYVLLSVMLLKYFTLKEKLWLRYCLFYEAILKNKRSMLVLFYYK